MQKYPVRRESNFKCLNVENIYYFVVSNLYFVVISRYDYSGAVNTRHFKP